MTSLRQHLARLRRRIASARLEPSPLLVASFGGVASKQFVIAAVGGDNIDLFHRSHTHTRTPPETVAAKTKVVYLFGDPLDAIVSFFNRRTRIHELHGFDRRRREGGTDWVVRHCRNLEGDWRALNSSWDLDAYLANGVDLFKLEEHFDNWTKLLRPYRRLLLRFESMWDYADEIAAFLELPPGQAMALPPKRMRASDWRTLPDDQREKLIGIYGGLRDKVRAFNDLKTV